MIPLPPYQKDSLTVIDLPEKLISAEYAPNGYYYFPKARMSTELLIVEQQLSIIAETCNV